MPINPYLQNQMVCWIRPKSNSLSVPDLEYDKRDIGVCVCVCVCVCVGMAEQVMAIC